MISSQAVTWEEMEKSVFFHVVCVYFTWVLQAPSVVPFLPQHDRSEASLGPLVWEGIEQLLPMGESEVDDVTLAQQGSILKEKSEEGCNA